MLHELLDLLRAEVNVRTIELVTSDADLVRLAAKPNYRTLGKRYGKRTPEAATAAAGLTSDQLRGLEAGQHAFLTVNGEVLEYAPEDVTIVREVLSDWVVQSAGPFVVALDPTLTPELRRDGLAREVVNRVQRLRKEAGYSYSTRITLAIDGSDAVLEAVRSHATFITRETLGRDLHVGARLPTPDRQEDLDIDGQVVTIAVARCSDERPHRATNHLDVS
jgi:isoleucyl-tRNA synthetase